MFTSREWPRNEKSAVVPRAPRVGSAGFGAWNALALKSMVQQLFQYAASHERACVVKLAAYGPRGTIAVLVVHRRVVLPPHGKANGITPALDVSYLFVPPPPLKTARPALRASAEKVRKLVAAAEAAHCVANGQQVPAVWCVAESADAIGEYLDYCHAAAPVRSLSNVPGTDSGVRAAFDCLKSELKRALLMPLYPTYPSTTV
ncbi:hypothetical protein H9P43_009056 [Blastocladiella emersonii ATCC 22665]|nr:hypothetical protein H9P43_009056 [Blastocladiella emersonii ATCC 22665]